MSNSSINYRSEIDGLRAVAVLGVILYHAGWKGIGGGYAGVDVFFVISGFLITSLMLAEHEGGSFSLLNFWKRRFSRILPALVVMTAFVVGGSFLVYFPEQIKFVGWQTAMQSIFSSNIYFYNVSGYFSPDHSTKPLLHTWSLAVEEQFYLFFPLLLVGLWKYGRSHIRLALGVIALLSLTASIYMVAKSADAAFYLLPFRAWELLCGSLIAGVAFPFSHKIARNVAGWAGLSMIMACFFLYTPYTLFPGIAALLPCLGATLFIWSNTGSQNSAGRALSIKPVVFVGLISYSLYLWHWPIMAMVDYIPLVEKNLAVQIAMILASFIAAFLSWKYVEMPFREMGRKASIRTVYAYSLAALILFGLSGAGLYIYGKLHPPLPGFENISASEKNINPDRDRCKHLDDQKLIQNDVCETNPQAGIKPDFAILGDSYGDAMTIAFAEMSKKHLRNGYNIYNMGCAALDGFHLRGNKDDAGCAAFKAETLRFIDRHHIKTVYLVGFWEAWAKNKKAYIEGDISSSPYKNPEFIALQRTVDALRERNIKIYIVLAPPEMGFNVPRMLGFLQKFDLDFTRAVKDRQEYLEARPEELSLFIRNNPDITFIDPVDEFCDSKICAAYEGDHALYYDTHHVSNHGAMKFAPLLDPYFRRK